MDHHAKHVIVALSPLAMPGPLGKLYSSRHSVFLFQPIEAETGRLSAYFATHDRITFARSSGKLHESSQRARLFVYIFAPLAHRSVNWIQYVKLIDEVH